MSAPPSRSWVRDCGGNNAWSDALKGSDQFWSASCGESTGMPGCQGSMRAFWELDQITKAGRPRHRICTNACG